MKTLTDDPVDELIEKIDALEAQVEAVRAATQELFALAHTELEQFSKTTFGSLHGNN